MTNKTNKYVIMTLYFYCYNGDLRKIAYLKCYKVRWCKYSTAFIFRQDVFLIFHHLHKSNMRILYSLRSNTECCYIKISRYVHT